jgi:hypothetical protein
VARQIGNLEGDGELHLTVEDVGHDVAQQRHVLALAIGRRSQPIQVFEPGDQVGVTDGLTHCPLGVTERPDRIQERTLGHVQRELQARQLLRRVVRSLDLDLEHAQELLEGALGLKDGAQNLGRLATRRCIFRVEQLVERGAARRVAAIERERAPVDGQCSGHVEQTLAFDVTELGQKLQPLGVRARDLDVLLQRVG